MEEWLKVIIQGIVQGFTEFLPVSSTGHLLIVSDLINFDFIEPGTFEIFIQIGTLFAIIAFYRNDLWQQVKNVKHDPAIQRFWLNILVASIPIAVLGFLLLDFIMDDLLADQTMRGWVIAITLILGGVIFLWIERRPRTASEQLTTHLTDITLMQACWVGIAQIFALIPGTSRSGATIVGGLLAKLDRPTATQFSFYLSIPALGGATILTFLFNLDELDTNGLLYLLGGAIVSAVVAWVTIDWLLRYISRHNFVLFGYYRIIIGIILMIWLLI
ncbi:MAG: undecaprenyl-diphosphate phosphatase [Phototrophicales bacterium]